MATKNLFFLFSILLSMFGTKAFAYDIAVENADGVTIYYNYINDGTELEVTYERRNSYSYWYYYYSDSVVIPEEVTYMNRTRKVTSIGDHAFGSCSDLTSVTIPGSVTSIGDNAFEECSNLASVHITNLDAWCKLSFLKFESNPLYYAHHLFLNGEEIKDLVIPNSVTSIGRMVFNGLSGLTSVTIPGSVTSIGLWAFASCKGLTSVTIGYGVTSIEADAFEYCTSLTSVTIPNSVTNIGAAAFRGCSSLTSLTIPNSVTSIGIKAFEGCDIPEIISKIEEPFNIDEGTFSNNTYLNATLYVPAGTIDKYKAKEGWNKFVFIEEETGGGDTPETKKCEKPTITFKDGKLVFSCATEGVNYQYNITASSVASGAGNNIDFTPKYTITTYATKDGYDDSDTATLEVSASDTANGDMNGDGVIDAADITIIVNIIMEQKE